MEDFEPLVNQYNPLIHHIMRKLNIICEKDEFYQIGLIALWEASQNFNPEKGQFLSYAYKSIQGKMLIQLCKSTKINGRELKKSPEYWDLLKVEEDVSFLEWYFPKPFLTSLTNNQYIWLAEYIQFGKTITDIAYEYHTTYATVKSWKRMALKKLKHYLEIHPDVFIK